MNPVLTPDQAYAARLNSYGVKQSQEETARQFALAREQSVTDQPHADKDGIAAWTGIQSAQGPILPPWGSRRREWALRLWDRHEYSTLWQGAVNGLLKRWCATEWVMDGGKILANKYQRVFRNATSGEWIGWDSWLSSVMRDYLRFDGGAWIEVVGGGDPRGELVGGVTGLSHLDSYTTWPTGDPEYPCVYWSRTGRYNLMHRSRVIHLVDMPDGDVLNPGYGLCALSRGIAVLQRQMYEQRYIKDNLNDIPSTGVVIADNLTPEQVKQAYTVMEARVSADEPGQPGKVLWLYSLNPAFPADLRPVTFSRPPEKFDWDTYVRIDVNMLALAIGEDPQDLWPLSSSAMGSGMQSEVLAKKAKGKMFGQALRELERALNGILPESLEFQFKISDPEEARREADVANAWAVALNAAGARMTPDEGRRLLSDNVEQIQNVVTDPSGEMVELPSTDVRPVNAGEIAPNTNPAPESTEQQAPAEDGQVSATDATPNAGAKAIDDVRVAFESDFNALVEAARGDDLNRRRFGVIARDMLRKNGDRAYRDGLKAGGVDADMDDSDRLKFAQLLAEQSLYVGGLGETLFKGGGVSDAQAAEKGALWFNKSIEPFYQAGLASADGNGIYEWALGSAEEHCPSCLRMNGQKHRLKEYMAKGITPQGNTLACRGFNCRCTLRRSKGASSGNWLS